MAKTSIVDMVVSAADLATLLGISDRRVRELRDRRLIPDNGRGRYVLGIAIPAYSAHQRAVASGHRSEGEDGEVLDLTAERARKAKEEADRLEMQNAQMRGELVARGDVEAGIIGAFSRVRAKLIAIPSKVAPLIAAMTEPRACETAIRKPIYEALEELAGTTVDDLHRDFGAVLDGVPSTAGIDGEPVGGSRAEA